MGQLSREDREELAQYYGDLYDPSEDPKQEPSKFSQKDGMCEGGVKMSDGGYLEDSGNYPDSAYITNDQQHAMAAENLAGKQPEEQSDIKDAPAPLPAKTTPQPLAASVSGELQAPVQNTNKLNPDQYDQLINKLQAGPGWKGGVMLGLAGLADSIMQGVARGGNPGFQKNIMESQQQQRQNLIAALNAKYGRQLEQAKLGQEGQRIVETGRHNKAEEAETALGRKIQGEQLARQQQQLESEENKTAMEQAAKSGGVFNRLENTMGVGTPQPNPKILARAQGKTDQQHVQAVAWAKTHPKDPRSAAILKINGQ